MFARASKEIDAKRKFDPSSMRVEDDGAVVGTCAGSNPGDAYDVRVRVRGKDASDETEKTDGAAEVEHEAPLVDVSCTCPAAKAQARGGAPPPQFGARTAAPPKAQPPRSCKHSAALLLWRARTLAADVDPDASLSRAETTAERPDERLNDDDSHPEGEREKNEAASLRAPPPPRPAAAPPRYNAEKKRRRLPPSLAQSAAAAAEAAAKRAARPAGETLAGGVGDGSVREKKRAKDADEDEEKTKRTSVAREKNPSAATKRAAVKREPGLGSDAAGAADDANGRGRTTNGLRVSSSGVSGASGASLVSLADREIVAKVQTIDDDALLAAARRAMLGESANEPSSAANASAEPFAGSASGAPSPPRSSRADPRPPPGADVRAAPAMKDMFASFLPAAFKAPATAPAPSAPAPVPAAGDASLGKTQTAGTAPPVSIAKPAAFTETAPSAGVAVSTGAVGGAPAAEVERKEGPKKMSFAELVASGGL